MPDINNFRQLDFQEVGEPADSDRVLIVEIDNDKVVGAKNYALAKLKGYISADALAYLEECRLINASVSEKEERVSNIASQSAELLESTRGETIESLEQTVISTEPGGVNVFTITQKNGSQKSLQTRNGLRGPEGPQGPAVPLVQTIGQSTTEAMSQKAVSDELNQLKSDLVAKDEVLSYEEIMATTPSVKDFDLCPPSANALKENIIEGNFTVLGSSTSLSGGTRINLTQPITNFKYLMVEVVQGYSTIALNIPTKFYNYGSHRFSFSHGKPFDGYGCQGVLQIVTQVVIIDEAKAVGWDFSSINVIGVN